MNPLIAAGVFLSIALADAAYVAWMIAVNRRRPLMAANFGVLVYLLGAFTVLNYIDNHWYLIPTLGGAWVGSYFTTKYGHRES